MAEKTIGAVLNEAAQARPDGVALKDDVREVSFAELRDEARRAAAAFASLGIGRGDRFAIWAPNSARWVVAALGGMIRGAILVPINTRLKGPEAKELITRTQAQAVFVFGDFLSSDYGSILKRIDPELSTPIIALDDVGEFSWTQFLESAKGYPTTVLDRDIALVEPTDISDIIFTSGTTGQPKGVLAAQGQAIANAHAWGAAVGLSADDKYLGVNPFFHTFGYKAGWLPSLIFKSTMLPRATFDVAQVYEIIERETITVFPGPPTVFEDMLRARPSFKFDISSLRASVTGAAVVPVELIRRMKDELEIDTVMTAYGLTECGGTATISHQDDPIELTANSVGAPLAGVAIRIVDDDGIDLGMGDHGEVLLKSDYNFVGYLDNEAATKGAFTPDGWLRTGDIGVLDENGYLKITGRKKEMFIVGGFNCYPAEIEFALSKHPAIAEVAVMGAPHPRLGEVGVAFVVRENGAEIEEEALRAWARDRIANFKVPQSIIFVDALRRTALGKIIKGELQALIPDFSDVLTNEEGTAT